MTEMKSPPSARSKTLGCRTPPRGSWSPAALPGASPQLRGKAASALRLPAWACYSFSAEADDAEVLSSHLKLLTWVFFFHVGGCPVTLAFFLCLQPDCGCYICYCRDSYDDVRRWVSQPLRYWDSPGGGLCLNVCSLQGKHTWVFPPRKMPITPIIGINCSCLNCKPPCSSVPHAFL